MAEDSKNGRTTADRRAGRFSWAVQLVNVGILAVLFGISIDWWGKLPERIAVHYGADGAPDRWAGPGPGSWFALPLVAATLTAFFLVLRVLKGISERFPWIVSLPSRKTFLELPPQARARVIDTAFNLLSLFPIPANLFLLYSQWISYGVASGEVKTLHWGVTASFLSSSGAILLFYILVLHASVRREARASGKK